MDIAPTGTATSTLRRLAAFGQSPWLDFIRRGFLADGSLTRLVAEDGLGGVTSNPAIFEKAIAKGAEYDNQIKALTVDGGTDPWSIYEALAVDDIKHAADILRPVYDHAQGRDGFVSLEVSPYLARDTQGTIAEARRLWAWVDHPNLMVKVPGTAEGVPAIQTLIADGININVTLLFGQAEYQAVAEAYMAGLEARLAAGRTVAGIGSVASFFISRIDVMIDAEIDRRVAAGDPEAPALRALRGKVAIAAARQAYAWYQRMVATPRWAALAAAGAAPQRLLWASTGTKDKNYSDVLYVDELIGPDTVNTIPPATMDAFRDHGHVRASLTEDLAGADHILAEVARLGLDLAGITAHLVTDGVNQFATAADTLLTAIAAKRAHLLDGKLAKLSASLPQDLADRVTAAAEDWRAHGKIRRLWAGDASLWSNGPEADWLGWLRVIDDRLAHLQELTDFQSDIRAGGFTDVLLIGMGGSSLGPEVLGATFGRQSGWPALHVLDSTDPQQIAAFESKLDLAKTLVIVSSKSGGTLEPNILQAYFWSRIAAKIGAQSTGARFVAVTDPGSSLQRLATREGFRRIFLGDPKIGGRFSVLSNFGLVPAAAAGIDIEALLNSALLMARSCAAGVPPAQNPGVRLGLILGQAALLGQNKLTIFTSPGIADLGAWLEQLIAESTGKHGQGIIPFDGEALARPSAYGKDRLFVHLRTADAPDAAQEAALAALAEAGLPVIRVDQPRAADIGQQFFLWEIATAVAGSVLGIDPFDQPDVEAAKLKAKALTSAYEQTGALPVETPFAQFGDFSLYASGEDAPKLAAENLGAVLAKHLNRITAGDYFAVMAYIQRDRETIAALDRLRLRVRDRYNVASAAEFGPRFLHSTGQGYKGGPPTGVFLQITADDAADIEVPGAKYSFGIVKAAQARGDLGVLEDRHRRALRVHIKGNVLVGLANLLEAMP